MLRILSKGQHVADACKDRSVVSPPSNQRAINQTEEELLGIPALMKRLGIGRTTIFLLIEEGLLEKVKIGRRTLVTKSSVDRYIDDLKVAARTQELAANARCKANLQSDAVAPTLPSSPQYRYRKPAL
ncbi:helix-turn-helix transcriptional regulator [Pseudorhodoplanes sp.]|uniref:helix-turn-helix transcriptional regulator n=1 Tax=Pseudorhodoplanes sp. TaxID=1934341 RepID=UPI003D0F0BCC